MKQRSIQIVAASLLFVAAALAQPANDNFANRFQLSGLLVETNGTTAGATFETGEPTIVFADGRTTAWYEWTAPATVTTTFRAGGNGYRALLGVYLGSS